MQDDSYWERRVTSALGRTVEGTVVEAELKRAVGFVGKAGHRVWRRECGTGLIADGYIDVFLAR